ncbi:MAG: hypothetical protein ACK2U1_06575 [Anaerolineales bacterium]|jgi:uncharacterized membrane protein YadS
MDRSIVNGLLWIVMWCLMFGMVAVGIYVRGCNLELTETQLFMKYWWYWVVVGALGMWMVNLSNTETLRK